MASGFRVQGSIILCYIRSVKNLWRHSTINHKRISGQCKLDKIPKYGTTYIGQFTNWFNLLVISSLRMFVQLFSDTLFKSESQLKKCWETVQEIGQYIFDLTNQI